MRIGIFLAFASAALLLGAAHGGALDIALPAQAMAATGWLRTLFEIALLLVVAWFYRVRLRRAARRMQVCEQRLIERERTSRELHDGLVQGFQGLVLKFQGAMQQLPDLAQTRQSRTLMEQALKRADAVLAEGRDRMRDLRDSVGVCELSTALSAAAQELSQLAPSVAFELRVRGNTFAMRPDVTDEAYRIGREALSNAYFHAGARHIAVDVDYGWSRFALRVRDDGKGIASAALDAGVPGDKGLARMRERATRLGGTLAIHSAPGAGTEVEFELAAAAARAESVS
ncbi:ATP-binding protein [Piscinibacter sp. XHJ-5]|uniref:sensor histidine kinase n=1 Tax=Piscinibacter sp. XHJ-5 TaxID=3037797 RepID=UPI00245292E9|nr:ATP-binding protein [Piscinibacter sp. XHJ-5]